MGTALGIIVFY